LAEAEVEVEVGHDEGGKMEAESGAVLQVAAGGI
jgi:hypothetical protein